MGVRLWLLGKGKGARVDSIRSSEVVISSSRAAPDPTDAEARTHHASLERLVHVRLERLIEGEVLLLLSLLPILCPNGKERAEAPALLCEGVLQRRELGLLG